jgi:hypothetical protein
MSDDALPFATGRCRCETLQYSLAAAPLFTHACHCLDCQRRTGTAFSMTTIVLRDDLIVTRGRSSARATSPRSTEHACAECTTVIYIESTAFPATCILRPGTLDDTSIAVPQAHIWVCRKQAWLALPDGVPQFERQYDPATTWPAASLARLAAASARH